MDVRLSVIPFIIAVITSGSLTASIVLSMSRLFIRILLDREFYSAEIMNLLKARGITC